MLFPVAGVAWLANVDLWNVETGLGRFCLVFMSLYHVVERLDHIVLYVSHVSTLGVPLEAMVSFVVWSLGSLAALLLLESARVRVLEYVVCFFSEVLWLTHLADLVVGDFGVYFRVFNKVLQVSIEILEATFILSIEEDLFHVSDALLHNMAGKTVENIGADIALVHAVVSKTELAPKPNLVVMVQVRAVPQIVIMVAPIALVIWCQHLKQIQDARVKEVVLVCIVEEDLEDFLK